MSELNFLMNISLQSYFEPSCRIEGKGRQARVEKSKDGKTTFERKVEMSEPAVLTFIDRLTELGVFRWECHYIQCCMLDGTSWTVQIEWNDRKLWSTGTNGYPPNWTEFMAAVSELLGLEKDLCQSITSQVDKLRKE